jgi:hypothetical protein
MPKSSKGVCQAAVPGVHKPYGLLPETRGGSIRHTTHHDLGGGGGRWWQHEKPTCLEGVTLREFLHLNKA